MTASTGNHGAATAWAGSRAGIAVQVFAPRGSSATKLALLERRGADLHIVGDDLDSIVVGVVSDVSERQRCT